MRQLIKLLKLSTKFQYSAAIPILKNNIPIPSSKGKFNERIPPSSSALQSNIKDVAESYGYQILNRVARAEFVVNLFWSKKA